MRKLRERTSNRPAVTVPWPPPAHTAPRPAGQEQAAGTNVLEHRHAPPRSVRTGQQNVLFHHGADASTGFFRRLSECRLGVRNPHKVGLMKTQPKGSLAESCVAGSEAKVETCALHCAVWLDQCVSMTGESVLLFPGTESASFQRKYRWEPYFRKVLLLQI